MRALLFFVLAVAVFVLIRFVFKRFETLKPSKSKPDQAARPNEQRMVSCEACGVHLPESDAISVEVNAAQQGQTTKHFCSKAHLQQFIDAHSDN